LGEKQRRQRERQQRAGARHGSVNADGPPHVPGDSSIH
jgi:hypothetical protein